MAYEVMIDNFDQEEWRRRAATFADYSIYQTWPYQQVRADNSGQKISRIIIKDENDNTVLMAQLRIATIRPFGIKIGYIQSGPLIMARDENLRCSHEAWEELRRAYVGSKLSLLRVVPNVRNDGTSEELLDMLCSSGFELVQNMRPYHTFMVPLNKSDEDIRAGIHRESRRNIRKAEKQNIELREGTSEELFDILEALYTEAKQRKGFKGVDSEVFARTQRKLTQNDKAVILVAYYDGRPVTAYATTHFGNTAVPIIWASNKTGLECGSPYLVLWRAYLSAKSLGMKYYDLGGIDKEGNPNGYLFKKRMGGAEQFHIGTFEAYKSSAARNILAMAEKVYKKFKK